MWCICDITLWISNMCKNDGYVNNVYYCLLYTSDRLGVFCGCDTIALESFVVGAIGWVGGVVNVLPASHAKLYKLAVEKKDYTAARKLFFEMLPTLELMEGGGKYTQFVKAGCKLMGHDVGAPRGPLVAATAGECRQLRQALKQCDEGCRL